MLLKLKSHLLVLLIGLVLASLIVPCVNAIGQTTGHPYMLFHTISETPGYQYRTLDPWKTWEAGIISRADGSLTRNFYSSLGSYDRVVYRADFANDLGLAYQITKNSQYSKKAKEALLNLDNGIVDAKVDRAIALGKYSLAYDFIQPTLDPATDTVIRDKLATSADQVYNDLNDNGTSRSYVSFADYHGQAYPNVGIAGAALSDYKNPNHLPLSSTPEDWNKVGTDYLFGDDKLHSYGRSLLSFGFDEVSGKYLNGGYKSYIISDFMLWLQVYNHTYKKNPFETYPSAKRAFTSELWESLPNGYSNNFVTLGNAKWTYHRGFMNLLDYKSKSNLLNYDELLEKSTILPYSRSMGGDSPEILYCVYENYNSIARSYPATTSHLDKNAIYQVFREGWNQDADWLSLVTWNTTSNSNRDMLHNDQLGVEYYSRGDLLLADAGENKYVLDKLYGYYDIHHNTIAIENPRTPFPVSPWSGSASQGILKGSARGLVTPATVDTIIQMPWIQSMKTRVTITKLMAGSFGAAESLSTPVNYERTILYPESDYFIVIDRMEGSQSWIYRNIFRPTSLMITPTKDANSDGIYSASDVGHVNGGLTIGSTPYNWLALPFKTEIKTGITTNSFTWTTKNPYGKDVRLDLYTSPSSEILIEKNVGRIGGYDSRSEVFSPILWFRTPQTTAEYRVTALLSSYTTEEAKTAQNIAVTGTGHALQVHSTKYNDYIYTGKGVSSFSMYTTDANTAFIRSMDSTNEFTLIDGSYLKKNGSTVVNMSQKADYFTMKQDGTGIRFSLKASSATTITLNNTVVSSVYRNGVVYTNWVKDDRSRSISITTTSGENAFEISGQSVNSVNSPPVLDFIGDKTVTAGKTLAFKINATDPDKNPFTYSATGLPTNATFSPTTRSFAWTPLNSQAGTHNVSFSVSDGSLKDSETVKIAVLPATLPPGTKTLPTAQFSASVTQGRIPLTVQFTDKSVITGAATYKWEFQNDAGIVTTTSTEKNPSITYRTTGNKTVKLMVTNASGSDSEIKPDFIKVS